MTDYLTQKFKSFLCNQNDSDKKSSTGSTPITTIGFNGKFETCARCQKKFPQLSSNNWCTTCLKHMYMKTEV